MSFNVLSWHVETLLHDVIVWSSSPLWGLACPESFEESPKLFLSKNIDHDYCEDKS